MINRIIKVREESNLSQEKFADRLGLSRNFINQVENGKKNISERTLADICREFNVNEEWLRTGRGNMKEDIPVEDEYFKAAAQISKGKDKLAMQAIIEYWKLDEKSKQVFRDYLKNVVEKSRD